MGGVGVLVGLGGDRRGIGEVEKKGRWSVERLGG